MSSIVIPAVICAKIVSRFLSDDAEYEGLLLGGLKSEVISETTDSVDHRISSKESIVLQGILPTNIVTDQQLANVDSVKIPNVQRVIGWYHCRSSFLTTISLKERFAHKKLCEHFSDPLIFVQFIFMPTEKETKICILFNEITYRDRSVRLKIPTNIVNLMDTDQMYYFQTNTGVVNFDSEIIRSLLHPGGDNFSVKHEVINSANNLFSRSISRLKSLHKCASTLYKDIDKLRNEIKDIRDKEERTISSSDTEKEDDLLKKKDEDVVCINSDDDSELEISYSPNF